jgi:hypothetical protein
MTYDPVEELRLCHPDQGTNGLVRFIEHHVTIKDKQSGQGIPFELWPAQYPLLDELCKGSWIYYLKARQLGVTWCIAAFMLWKCLYHRFYTAICVNQSLPYAVEFVEDKIKFMHRELPDVFRIPFAKETTTIVKFGQFEGMPYPLDSNIHAVAGTEKSGRSFTCNFLLFDEAAFQQYFLKTLNASEPGLKNAGGHCAIVSTSDGPKGAFYKIWRDIEKRGDVQDVVDVTDAKFYRTTRWIGVFLPWNANPNRTQEWYDEEAENHEHDPDYMRREFPRSAKEAFMAAGGRIYPKFLDRDFGDEKGHLLTIKPDEIDETWPRYRGIDWGESVSAFVCLWTVEIPSGRPCLTVDPRCENLIKEMLAFSYKEDSDDPEEKDDHGPDALRYIVATYGIQQWLHVYREWYIYDAVSKGYTTQSIAAGIKRRSGWQFTEQYDDLSGYDPMQVVWTPEESAKEEFLGTVYDRSRPMLGLDLIDMDIDCEPHRPPPTAEGEKLDKKEERREGRIMVNRLVVGALPNKQIIAKTAKQLEKERLAAPDLFKAMGIQTAVSMERTLRQRRASQRRSRMKRRRLFR